MGHGAQDYWLLGGTVFASEVQVLLQESFHLRIGNLLESTRICGFGVVIDAGVLVLLTHEALSNL